MSLCDAMYWPTKSRIETYLLYLVSGSLPFHEHWLMKKACLGDVWGSMLYPPTRKQPLRRAREVLVN